jgi:hypothetical protein
MVPPADPSRAGGEASINLGAPRTRPAQSLQTSSSLGAGPIRRRARLGRLGLVATIELIAKFREVFEQSNRPWIFRPQRRLIDQERTLIGSVRPTISPLTDHRLGRVGESRAHGDIRRAQRLFHGNATRA